METHLADWIRDTSAGKEVEAVLRSCVHCGFCTATCPTYQLTGGELDGPRGRIYLMKQMFEGDAVSASTRDHLDRCLTCRSCESTCPSGVQYHKLLDIGRATIEERVPRSFGERMQRSVLRAVIPNRNLFNTLLAVGNVARPVLPKVLSRKMPTRGSKAGQRPPQRHARRMLILEGCVQPALSPNTNAATSRVLDRLGISVVDAPNAGCCGAVDFHMNAQDAGLARARRNIDAWWPAVEQGAEAIVQTASGCGAFVKEYGYLLRDDPAYAAKANRVSALARDLVEVLRDEPLTNLNIRLGKRLAFHSPCTLQHAQKLGGAVESVLTRLGFELTAVPEGHLCCGSAGTYSITQPELSTALRDRKLDALESGNPETIATANIGCQTHLGSAGRTPVRHWIELLDEALSAPNPQVRARR
ncbi:glycolate oxidase subunit GlcF [Trinickia dinghuensis]|uniref:Glycolate oxidase iron-sulfur subunit n=1 Tax=Trinickia dinghuensis TaxID=2291023 RepID=A0A3D8K281_9BURK|nr:glycolate oxidase subunit GlcF [Trinickia dinghuensis]RDU99260.1 glycolate oxidase iron-sulfur subunit [Trinickia dinghuensis]